jgi:hypothetical protein
MRDHEPTQTTQPPVSIRRVAVIRTDGRRLHVHPTTQLTEDPNATVHPADPRPQYEPRTQ